MLSGSKGKATKRVFGGKISKLLGNKGTKQTPTKGDAIAKVERDAGSESDDSSSSASSSDELYDPDQAGSNRMSRQYGYEYDDYSLDGDAAADAQSKDDSIFTDNEDDRGEAVENSDDDSDDMYFDEDETDHEFDHKTEEEGAAGGECGRSPPMEPVLTERQVRHGVTASLMEYTTDDLPIQASIRQIDAMMKSVRQVPDDDTIHVGHEDSADLLSQLELALDHPASDPHPYAGEDVLEYELEAARRESETLAHLLGKSASKIQTLEEKLSSSKQKVKEIEEIGEQVHIARHFALKSIKVTSLEVSEVVETQAVRIIPSFHEEEEGGGDKVDTSKTSDAPDEIIADIASKAHDSKGVEYNVSNLKEKETGIPDQNSADLVALRKAERKAKKKAKKERQRLEKEKPRSPAEEKLRASMIKAKEMEEFGDQIRTDPSCEVGEAETEEEFTPRQEDFQHANEELSKSAQLADMQSMEVSELRERLQEQQAQIEGLEHERDFHEHKVHELSMLVGLNSNDDVREKLTQNSRELAELSMTVTKLQQKLAEAEQRASTLEAERDANKAIIVQLSESLWSKEKASGSTEDAVQALIKQGGVIPQHDALQMTIESLQKKIENLEDEKQAFLETVQTLTTSVVELTQENDARAQKISALENQFLVLNQRQGYANTSTGELPQIEDASSNATKQEKLLRFKAWANNRINQAQEQYQTMKEDLEVRRVTSNPDRLLP